MTITRARSQYTSLDDLLPRDCLDILTKRNYSLPLHGEKLRLAFVGQSTYFEICSLHSSEWVDVTFIEFRAGADVNTLFDRLSAYEPHLVIIFRPEIIPESFLSKVSAITLGYLTEPLPRTSKDAHDDLKLRLEYLQSLDPKNFDRIISFDPLIADSVSEITDVWRSFPIPVIDELYKEPGLDTFNKQPLFVGRSTPHREHMLVQSKHEFDLLHIAHGLGKDALVELFASTSIGVNVHNEQYPSFENRVSLHLAAGHLVISEPLSPTHGLEPGIDFIEVNSERELYSVICSVRENPKAYYSIRARGQKKAELFRASTVYPRLINDLCCDISVFGSERMRDGELITSRQQ